MLLMFRQSNSGYDAMQQYSATYVAAQQVLMISVTDHNPQNPKPPYHLKPGICLHCQAIAPCYANGHASHFWCDGEGHRRKTEYDKGR